MEFRMAFPKHGYWGTRTYATWSTMLQRCRDANSTNYPNYGGRGVSVCERWLKFENFLADMGERPVGMSIDRVDVDGDYEPDNSRWASAKVQGRNRRNVILRSYNGVTASVSELAELHGHPARRVYQRIACGWTLARALETK